MKYKNKLILFLLLISLPLWGEDFWTGVDFFRGGKFQEAAATLKPVIESWQKEPASATKSTNSYLPLAANLYSLALVKSGRLEEGYKEFASFYQQGILDEEGRFNYAVTALQKKDFSTAYQVASQAASQVSSQGGNSDSFLDFNYLAGLAAFGLENWQEAEEFFKKSQAGEGDFFLHYYLGLSQFRQGKLEAAYLSLEILSHLSATGVNASSPQEIQDARLKSLNLALHCALRLYQQTEDKSWWDRGLALALQLIDSAPDEKIKQGAVLQAALIYRDGKEDKRALELLKPYSKGRDELSLSCRLLQAELLTSMGNLEEGIREYQQIADLCSPSNLGRTSQELFSLGDKAAYRRGELLYFAGYYEQATEAFVQYRRTYPSGMFQDGALYFNGGALMESGLNHQAILQYETLVKQFPDSPYVFSSLLELMNLYQATQNYSLALNHGNQLLSRFFQQAQGAGVPEKMGELRLLEQGLEFREAVLLTEYQVAGEYRSIEGRRIGVELALFYGPSSGKEAQGEEILLQILENYGPGEEAQGAEASYLLGDLYRSQNRYQEAAREFLNSAELYLKTGSDYKDRAATALYRGAESFDGAGMKSDSKAIAQKLVQLYPKSQWAQAATIFL